MTDALRSAAQAVVDSDAKTLDVSPAVLKRLREALAAPGPTASDDTMRLDFLQQAVDAGCVSMCVELEGGLHVTLDPIGGASRAARNVRTVREGLDKLRVVK